MLTSLLSRLRRIRATKVCPLTTPKGGSRALNLETLESREVPAIIYALQGTVGSNNTLLRFDSATPATITTTPVTGLGAGETLQGIDFRPRTGQLVGITFPANSTGSQLAKTYTINPATGAATLVGTTATTITNGSDAAFGDIDFNPTVDRLRYVAGDGTVTANARINPNNGALVLNDTAITPNTAVLIGAAYDRDFDRLNGTSIPTTLYAIDRTTGMLGTIGSVNGTVSPNGGVFTPIGSLGFTLNATNEGGFDIAVSASAAANNGGLGIAYAVLTSSADNMTRLYTINLTTGVATPIGLVGTGGAEIFDIAVVPDSVTIVGSGVGATGDVRILDSNTGAVRTAISNPFPGFKGGVRVAAGDVTGDGVPDIIAAAIFAQGNVRVYDGATGQPVTSSLASFFAFPNFLGTVNVAAGDVNGDGFDDILVSANGVGANGAVKVFSGKDGSLLASFLAYQGFSGNTTVAAGDFDNDGIAEIVTTAAINGHTKVFKTDGTLFTSASLPSFQNSFFAFSPYLGDVSLAVGDVTGDGIADFVLSSGSGVPVNVRVLNGKDGSAVSSFIVSGFGANYTGGATVGLTDFNRDGRYDLVVAPNFGAQATVFAFDSLGNALGNYPAFANFLGGASVSGSRF